MTNPLATTLNTAQFEAGMGVQQLFWLDSVTDNVTATPSGTQANAYQITTQFTRVTTVATSGDAVKLPIAIPGNDIVVVNHGNNPMTVFGSGSDTVDDVAGATGVQQMQNSYVLWAATSAGKYYSNGLATGYVAGIAGAFETVSSAVVTASTTHTQGGATPITTMQVGVTTNNASDAVVLPPSQAGMSIAVVNLSGANAMQVYASGSDTINGTAGSTGVAQAANAVTLYLCFQTSKWVTK
jgi:hypothetical protein